MAMPGTMMADPSAATGAGVGLLAASPVPSAPSQLSPQQYPPPSAVNPQTCCLPTVMATNEIPPATATGVGP